jgi:hypothetical protein
MYRSHKCDMEGMIAVWKVKKRDGRNSPLFKKLGGDGWKQMSEEKFYLFNISYIDLVKFEFGWLVEKWDVHSFQDRESIF